MRRDQPFLAGARRRRPRLGAPRRGALDEAGLRPALIVGTSMGAIVGAAPAAGMRPDQIQRMAERSGSVYRGRKRANLALFDPTPVLARIDAALGSPRIEDLPGRLAITAYDLVSGTPAAITTGPLVEALRAASRCRSSSRQPAMRTAVDAGPWESVPVTSAPPVGRPGDRRLGRRPEAGLHGRPPGRNPAARRLAADARRRQRSPPLLLASPVAGPIRSWPSHPTC